tara:strand:+ start:213 stop:446 length:234 start_codon:yes stop_codon:yes gene_type:complete
MAYKMKYTNGKTADPSAFPFKTEENVIDNTVDNTISNDMGPEKGKNDELIDLLKQENEINKKVEEARKGLLQKTKTI